MDKAMNCAGCKALQQDLNDMTWDRDSIRAAFNRWIKDAEDVFATIKRNRSGYDADAIDYECKVAEIEAMESDDKQDIADIAYALYESVCRAAGTTAKKAVTHG